MHEREKHARQKRSKKGLGSALFSALLNHPELKGLKTWSLRTTEEARKIYEKNGFKIAGSPETILEINNLEIYTAPDFLNLYRNN
jgi:GNAT superfamily N-acetyltransferase